MEAKSHSSRDNERHGDRNSRPRSRSPVKRDYEDHQRRDLKRRRSSDGDLEVPRKPRRRSSDGDLEVERRPRNNLGGRPRERYYREDQDFRRPRGDGRRRQREDDDGRGDRRREGREDFRRNRTMNLQNSDSRYGGQSSGADRLTSKDDSEETSAAPEQDFGLSGKLAAETNTYRGVVINYSEPEEARIPKTRWRFYVFKGEESLPTFYIHRQSAYLIGRDRRVCDMAVDHPSCSKQHAVLQYRLIQYDKPDGSTGKRVRPYIIDLGSTNGTYINSNRIESAKYYELKERDMLKFGFSSREYILLHENSNVGEDPPPTNATDSSTA